MSTPRADLILSGQVVVSFAAAGGARGSRQGVQVAEAVGIGGGRVVAIGSRAGLAAAAPRARRLDFGEAAIIPGIHDFHLHLAGMAAARREVRLGPDATPAMAIALLRDAAGALGDDEWLRGGGWSEALLAAIGTDALAAAVGDRKALVYSHDSHSAWASPAAVRAARLADAPDPAGGHIQRDEHGAPTGVLREAATDLVETVAAHLGADGLRAALDETLTELAGLGITGGTDAGDTSAAKGVGEMAFTGESASHLFNARGRLDGRFRVTLNLPADAIDAAVTAGVRSGDPVRGTTTLRWGWTKLYADGALGSRTAALFAPYTCGHGRELGIARHTPAELTALVGAARRGGISSAIHAIGDRAVAAALDALAGAGARHGTAPPDRIEHAQLVRAADRARFAGGDVTASVQPIHCAADRALAEACWADRLAEAYAYRSLADAGARLAFGTDAPIEPANPWVNLFAALHRRHAGDGMPDWRAGEALDAAVALAAMTLGPALAAGRADEGHLQPGAVADLAVLNTDLGTLLAGDEALAEVRSVLTLVAGREVHRS